MEITEYSIQKMIDNSISAYANKAMFSMAKVPAHVHNGVDSAKINAADILGLEVGGSFSGSSGTLVKSAGGGTGSESVICGFQPKLIQFFAYPSGNNNTFSIGTQDLTGSNTIFRLITAGSNSIGTDTGYVVVIWNDAQTLNTELEFTSFDTTGFTVNWYTDDVSTICKWIAFG